MRFRNKHSIEVFSEINEEVKKIVSQNKARASMKTEEMTLQDMTTALRDMPKQEEMMKNYQVHIDLLNKIIQDLTK